MQTITDFVEIVNSQLVSGEEMSSKQNKGYPIGATIFILVIAAVVLMFGVGTCEKCDAGDDFGVFLGVVLTGSFFALLVFIVKVLMKGDDSEE